jgi:hypothetical protein
MYLLPIAWLYVVLMMAAAEATSPQGTLLGAFFTLLLYGVLPVSILMYLMGSPKRRRAQRAAALREPSTAINPDGSSHAPGDAIASEREKP